MAEVAGRPYTAYKEIRSPATLRRLLEASLLLESSLELRGLLSHIVDEAVALAGARFGALGVLDQSSAQLADFIVSGLTTDQEAALRKGALPKGEGLLGHLLNEPSTIRVNVIADHPASVGFPPNHPPMASFLGTPIRVRDQVYGNLYLTEKVGADEFSPDDETVVEALALFAGIAIENAQLHLQAGQVAVFEERERMARDLHDGVIQRLFATGLKLQGLAAAQTDRAVRSNLASVVEDLDETIREVRATIFELGGYGRGLVVTNRVASLIDELRPVLGFTVVADFAGPVDSAVDEQVADHVVNTVREALTNVNRHAEATSARVRLALVGKDCRLEVTDDGKGFVAGTSGPDTGRGLRNLRRRAEELGGSFEIVPSDPTGTTLIWQVPAFDGSIHLVPND